MKVGDKIKFKEEVQRYTVQAMDDRYLVCTKPFNLKKETVLYSLVDLKENVRGRDNLVFGFPYNYPSKKGCQKALKWLQTGEMEVSHRHRIKLQIVKE